MWLPIRTAQWLQTKLLQAVEGKPPAVMRPKHKLLEQNPTIRGDFIEKVRTGIIHVHRGTVERLTEDGMVISATDTDADGEKTTRREEELKVDVVIACTGYNQFDCPFLPREALRSGETRANRAELYKLIVPPKYRNVFVMGHAELVGAAAPVFDAQARWACSVVCGRIQLPPPPKMQDEIRARHAWQDRHFLGTERHALAIYTIPYVDELLGPLGADPSLGRCLAKIFTTGHPWRALRVLNAVWFGIPSAAQWRLFGYGAKEELATETLLRIAAGAKTLSDGEVKLLSAIQVRSHRRK